MDTMKDLLTTCETELAAELVARRKDLLKSRLREIKAARAALRKMEQQLEKMLGEPVDTDEALFDE